jgi:hypothetical protein
VPNNPFPSFVPGVDGIITIAPYFGISTPPSAAGGAPFAFTVTAFDASNSVNTSYSGTVHLTSTDGAVSFAPSSNVTLVNGTGVFTATLQTGGSQFISATDSTTATINGTSNPIVVSAVSQDHFVISAPSSATAGGPFNFTVTALDSSNSPDSSYTGIVHFTSSDAQVSAGNGLPADTLITGGQGVFTATMKTAGSQTLTATDTVAPGITGNTTIAVSPAAASQLIVAAPSNATAGVGVTFTVTAVDPFNNVATTYAGSVTFSTSDHGSSTALPGASGLTNGQGVFSATLTTAGSQSITAADTVNTSITAGTATVAVSAAAASHFVVTAPAATTAGNNLTFTVVAEDKFNNTATGYAGVATFSSTDTGPSTKLPPVSGLTGGIGTFSATLTTAGSQTLTATDNNTSGVTGNISGTSATISVSAGSASHFAVSAAASTTAGQTVDFTVVAEDPFNNTAVGYGGTVTFSSSDKGASTGLPLSSPLTAGVGIFSATLTTAGTQTLTATDSLSSAIQGHSGPITVTAAAATHFALIAPAASAPGHAFAFTVNADDPFNNTDTNYSGQVTFSTSDPAGSVPNTTLVTGGSGVFSATLQTTGNQSITAADTVQTTITGTATINVNNSQATHFVISAASSVTAGNVLVFTVTAETSANTAASLYAGTVTFSSTDTGASTRLPADSTLVNGVGTFSATLTTAGNQTLTVADTVDNTIAHGTANVTVSAAAATHFGVVNQAAATAGSAFVEVVTAFDPFNNVATSYNGTVHFTSSDPQIGPGTGLPPDQPFFSLPGVPGIGFFAIGFKTAGPQTVTVTDSGNPGLTGTSNSTAVSAAAATTLVVTTALPTYPGVQSGPNQFASTGQFFTFTITAKDSFGNVAPTYSGLVKFTSSDTAAGVVLPSNSALTNGVGTFSASLRTPGTQTLFASDFNNASIAGSSAVVTRGLVVTGFTQTPTGFTIQFNQPVDPTTFDYYGSTAQPPSTNGLIPVASNGQGPDIALTAGLSSSSRVQGSYVFVDPSNLATTPNFSALTFVQTSGPLTNVLNSYHLTLSPAWLKGTGTGIKDLLGDPLDGANTGSAGGSNFAKSFNGAPSGAPVVSIASFARGPSNTDSVFLPTAIGTGNTFNLIYTNPNTSSTGTATVTFSTILATLQNNIQTALNNLPEIGMTGVVPNAVTVILAPANGAENIQITFQNSLATATSNLLSSTTPGVVIGLANIDVHNNIAGSGIPINIANAANVTSGSFTLQYNPSLLTITGASAKIAGTSFTLFSNIINSPNSATAVLSLSSPSPISATTALTIGTLLATVPLSATASYGSKQLLHFSAEQLNGTGGPLAGVVNQDGVQLLAYFGDVVMQGALNTSDASNISRVAIAEDTGFAAYPLLDPAIVGDVTSSGFTNSADASVVNAFLAGVNTPEIPLQPLTVTPSGPDPVLSLPSGLIASQGSTITVPVNIDTAKPVGSTGMNEAVLALQFDPHVVTVAPSDVQLGTLPQSGSGWRLTTAVSATGQIGVDLFSPTPIQTTDAGSLVTITLHVLDTAPVGTTALSLVPQVNPKGPRAFQTEVADAQGAFVLHTAQTNTGSSLALPAQVTVTGQEVAVPAGEVLPTPVTVASPPEETVSTKELVGPISTFDIQQSAALAAIQATANALPLTVVEQVFGEPVQHVAHESALAQPSPIFSWEENDLALQGIRDLAFFQTSATGQRDWVASDTTARLDQFVPGELLATAPALLDKTVPLGEDGTSSGSDSIGMEAFFARTGKKGN